MNDNNNQNKNYVTPEKVDLTKVEINQENKGALNRERDNIISTSIQANEAIDEKSAAVVNNTIKVKKRNPFVSLLIGLFFISIAGILAYFGFRLLEDYIKKDDAKYTTTTTTTKKVNFFENYTYDETKLRKYQNENSILILFPNTFSISLYCNVLASAPTSAKLLVILLFSIFKLEICANLILLKIGTVFPVNLCP